MKILVPTDFSDNAAQAISVAKKIALATKGKITLLFAFYAVYDFAAHVAEMEEQIEKDAKIKLKVAAKKLEAEGVDADIKVIQNSVSNAVVSTANDLQYDLIVMGTQGASGIQKALFGSNTASVIKSSEVPVLAVPSKVDFESIDAIVLAVDSLPEAPSIYEQSIPLMAGLQVPFVILHVSTDNHPEDPTVLNDLEIKLKQSFPGSQFEVRQIKAHKVVKGIEQYLNTHPNSLLVMFSRHKSFFENLFYKSDSVEMAFHTHVPLLVIKEKKA